MIEVGGVGLGIQVTPQQGLTLRIGQEALLHTALIVRDLPEKLNLLNELHRTVFDRALSTIASATDTAEMRQAVTEVRGGVGAMVAEQRKIERMEQALINSPAEQEVQAAFQRRADAKAKREADECGRIEGAALAVGAALFLEERA